MDFGGDSGDGMVAVDRLALAREVIVSAGNVLRAAGFGREEIGAFFAEAAAQLGAGEAPAPARPADPLAQVVLAFSECAALHRLQALAGEALLLPPLGEDMAALKRAFDLAMQMAPVLAEAQDALRGLAEEAGLPLVATLAEAQAAEGAVVCLEAFAGAYAGASEAIGTLVDALAAREDGEAFAFLLRHLGENGVVIAGPLQARLARGAALLER